MLHNGINIITQMSNFYYSSRGKHLLQAVKREFAYCSLNIKIAHDWLKFSV